MYPFLGVGGVWQGSIAQTRTFRKDSFAAEGLLWYTGGNTTPIMNTAPLTSSSPALTWRSALFGLLGIVWIAGFAGYHDSACFYGSHMVGNHLPGGAIAYIVFLGLGWNGLVGRIFPRLALGPKELVVALMATLMACFPPVAGLFRYALRILMLPWYYLPGHPEWAQHGLLELIDPRLFPAPGPGAVAAPPGSPESAAYQQVYQGFFSGLAQGNRWVPLWRLPLREWAGPLLFWGPLVFLLSLACIALQIVVHRQWAHHEQLSYPVAQVFGSLCSRRDGRAGVPDIFRDRLFWWGFVPVFAYYLLDFLGTKFPLSFPRMAEIFPALKHWWVPLNTAFPAILHGANWWHLAGQDFFFTILGIAYFVSNEISLTMGLTPLMLTLFGMGVYYATGTPLSGEQVKSSNAGAYLGYMLILLYTGRTYFRALFARAFGLRRGGTAELGGDGATAVLAARVFVAAIVGEMVVLHWMGLEWVFAVLFALMIHVVFLIFTRIVCETGIPFLGTDWSEWRQFLSLAGPATVGPKGIVMGSWLHSILLVDPRECLMPYVASSVKIANDHGLRMRRVFWLLVGSVALALAIAFLASLYTQYNLGALGTADNYAPHGAVRDPFDLSALLVREMKDLGEYEAATRGSFLTRLPLWHSDPRTTPYFLGGIFAVALFASLRFRFGKFPLHPVVFMVWGSYACSMSWWSFLAGWFVKTLVVRFGGGRTYQSLKPLFIGIIGGEMVFLGLHVVYNLLYLLYYGTAPSANVTVLPV